MQTLGQIETVTQYLYGGAMSFGILALISFFFAIPHKRSLHPVLSLGFLGCAMAAVGQLVQVLTYSKEPAEVVIWACVSLFAGGCGLYLLWIQE